MYVVNLLNINRRNTKKIEKEKIVHATNMTLVQFAKTFKDLAKYDRTESARN
jgi:hypothetical protein